MDQWGIFTTIVYIVGFLATVIGFGVKLTSVINKNTYAITCLTNELKELTVSNTKDHDHFHKSINSLEQNVALIKQKHNDDMELLKEQCSRKD